MNLPRIVVEGMDNSGKTTLVHSLAEQLNLTIIKTHGIPHNYTEIYDYHHWIRNSPKAMILDRAHFISDHIYGTILRGYSLITPQQMENFRSRYYLIYCRPSTIEFDDRPQMYGVKDHAQKLQNMYDSVMDTLRPDLTFNYQTQTLEEIEDVVRKAIG